MSESQESTSPRERFEDWLERDTQRTHTSADLLEAVLLEQARLRAERLFLTPEPQAVPA